MDNLTQEEKSEWLGKDSPVNRLLPTQDDFGDTFQQQNWRYMKDIGSRRPRHHNALYRN